MANNVLPDDLPERKIHVRIAIGTVLAVSVIGYSIDAWITELIPKLGDTFWAHQLAIVKAVLENLMAGAWGALILALIVRWIIAFVDPRDRVIEIASNAITSRLRSNANTSRKYVFMGNTATFVTATAVPILVCSARQTGIPRTILLYLIDPMDSGAVSSYVAFKKQISQANSIVADESIGRWVTPHTPSPVETKDDVIAKVVAAIYLATFASLQAGMTVSIFLRRSFTPFRADMTDKEVVLTQESRHEPGVAFSSRGHFYGWYHKEVEAQQMQATRLDLEGSKTALRRLNLASACGSEPQVRKSLVDFLSLFGHLKPLTYRTKMIDLAVKRIMNPTHSY